MRQSEVISRSYVTGGVCRALIPFSLEKGLKFNSGGKENPRRTKPFVKQDPKIYILDNIYCKC